MAPLLSFLHHLHLATIFGLLGNTISFMVFLSPIPTFYRIYKKKSTQGYQCVPYVVALFSSMLWILYAFHTPASTFLKTINSFGCFIETIYIGIFLFYAARKAKIATTKLIFIMNIAGFGSVVFITFVIAKTTIVRVKILGWICLVFSLCVFVAPLGVMRQVIRTKSVEYMPFLLSFFLTISAVIWFFYGLATMDYFVAIPNVLGFTFGIVQMVLYAMYRKSGKTILMEDLTKEKNTPLDSAEPNVNHKIIEVVKLGAEEIICPVEASVKSDSGIINGDEEGLYKIEIHNVKMEMIENMKKMEALEAVPLVKPCIVTLAC